VYEFKLEDEMAVAIVHITHSSRREVSPSFPYSTDSESEEGQNAMIEDMKSQYSKVWVWTLIVIALLIIVGSGAYFLIRPQTALPTGIATTTSPVAANTYGMIQYTDPDFGFAFWYPSSWQILGAATKDTSSFPGGTLVKTLQVGSPGGVIIYVVNSPAQTITDEENGHASPIAQTKYFYNFASEQWMVAYPEGISSGTGGATTTANISNTTMSGLVMLPSGRRFDTSIVPLSTTIFLVVSDGGGNNAAVLAKTISLVGASVNPSTLSSTLQIEANAYVSTQQKTSTNTASNIQQLNAPGSVSLQQGGIAEIRNKNFYFTLQSLSSSLGTIQITPVGCWNSFPSDPPPQVRCMIATMLIPPQTLSAGQTYSTANYGITLTHISNGVALFSVNMPTTVQ
jgi:hypothetical protein